MILMPDSGTDATTAPFLRQIEQLQRRGFTMPSGKSSSSTTAPQWQLALCLGRMTVSLIFLIMAIHRRIRRSKSFNRLLDLALTVSRAELPSQIHKVTK